MNSILDIYNSVLKYNNNEINFIIDYNGNIWFKFINITQLLNYKSRKDALKLIKKENKKLLKHIKTFNKTDNHPNTVFIDEVGLYMFLIKSKMKNAVEFQLWVVSEVLPNLRKFGKYEVTVNFIKSLQMSKKWTIIIVHFFDICKLFMKLTVTSYLPNFLKFGKTSETTHN